MARFLKPVQNQVVDLTSQPSAQFYASLLDNANKNLERAISIQANYLDKINDIPIYTKEDRDATIKIAEERLASAMEDEFITPSKLVKTIIEVNRQISPGIQALRAKDQEVKAQQKLKESYGLDWMGNDVSNVPIVNHDGKYVDLSSIRGINYNKAQLRNIFERDVAAEFLKIIEGPIVASGRQGILTRVTEKGLTDAQKAQYAPGTQLARKHAEDVYSKLDKDVVDDLISIYGDKETVLKELEKINFGVVNDPKYAYQRSYQDIQDNSAINRQNTQSIPTMVGSPIPGPSSTVNKNSSDLSRIEDAIYYIENPNSTPKSLLTRISYSINKATNPAFSIAEKAMKQEAINLYRELIQDLKLDYESIWNRIASDNRIKKEDKEKVFLYTLKREVGEDKEVTNELYPIVFPNSNKNMTMLLSLADGVEYVRSDGSIETNNKFLFKNNGSGNVYSIDRTGDLWVSSTSGGNLRKIPLTRKDNTSNPIPNNMYDIAKMQKKLYKLKVTSLTDKEIDKINEEDIGYTDSGGNHIVLAENINGNTVYYYVVYKVARGDGDGFNKIYMEKRDPFTHEIHYYRDQYGNKIPMIQEVNLNETAVISAQTLGIANNLNPQARYDDQQTNSSKQN